MELHNAIVNLPQDFVEENTPADIFENAIRRFGVVSACEWFGHSPDSQFTIETISVLNERANGGSQA